MSGISVSGLKAFETGKRHPREVTLAALIDALGLTREQANPIRTSAGFGDDWYGLFHQRYPSGAIDLAAEVERVRWPAFVSNQGIDVLYANRPFQRLFGVDMQTDLEGEGERNFLSQASNPRFVEVFDNFDEIVKFMIGLVKGDPRWHQAPTNPAPWLRSALDQFMRGDPELVRRVLNLWNEAEPIPHRARHIYNVRLMVDGRLLRFVGSTTIADLWNELSWNEWVPDDVATWEAMAGVSP